VGKEEEKKMRYWFLTESPQIITLSGAKYFSLLWPAAVPLPCPFWKPPHPSPCEFRGTGFSSLQWAETVVPVLSANDPEQMWGCLAEQGHAVGSEERDEQKKERKKKDALFSELMEFQCSHCTFVKMTA